MRDPRNASELAAMHGFLGFVMSGDGMGGRGCDMDLLVTGGGSAARYDIVGWEDLGDGLVVDVSFLFSFLPSFSSFLPLSKTRGFYFSLTQTPRERDI